MPMDDAALLERWTRRRDTEAFNEIVERFAGQVFGTCRRVLNNDADAEEVAQEAFFALARCPADVRTSLGGWLHRVATYKSRDRIRGEVRRRHREFVYGQSMPASVEPRWNDIREYVDEAIEAIPEELRDAVVAHFLGRKAHAEIAAELGLTRRAVSYRIERGLEAVRGELRRRGVAVSAAALGTSLASDVSAAPLSLKASLGKLAIAAGTTSGAGGSTAISSMLGSLLVMKTKTLLVAGIMVAIAAGLYYAISRGGDTAPDWSHVPEVKGVSSTLADGPTSVVAPPPKTRVEIVPAVETPTLDTLLALSRLELERESDRYPLITDPSQYASVSGTVIDGDGYPVPDATIALVPTHAWGQLPDSEDIAHTAASGADGVYRIESIRRTGDFRVVATKPGFESEAVYTAVQAGKDAIVDITMKGGFSIQGRVVTATGGPVPGAYLYCIGLTGPRDLVHDLTRATQTDGEGYFSFGFKEDQVGLVAAFRVQSAKHGDRTFPDILIQNNSLIELRLEPPAVIRGTVRDSSDKPLSGARLTFYAAKSIDVERADGEIWASPSYAGSFLAVSDGSGRYATEVDTGMEFHVNVEVHGFDDGRERMEIIKALAAGETREYNPVFNTDTIAVHAAFVGQESGQPLTQYVPIEAFAIYEGKTVAKGQQDGLFAARFTLPGAKGAYSFQARYMYDADVAGDISAVYELEGGDEIEIELNVPDPQRFEVRVVDPNGSPVEGARIRFQTETWGGNAISYGQTNADGRLSEPILLAPMSGARMIVEKPGYALAFGQPFSEQSPGTVHPEETVVLWPGAGFEGVLLDSAKQPLANTAIAISVTNREGQEWPLHAATDSAGHFTIVSEAPADVVDIAVFAGDGAGTSVAQQMQLEANAIAWLGEFTLE